MTTGGGEGEAGRARSDDGGRQFVRCQRTLKLCTMLMITGIQQGWKIAGKWRSDPVFLASFQKMQDLAQQPLPWNNYLRFLTKANSNVACAARYFLQQGH